MKPDSQTLNEQWAWKKLKEYKPGQTPEPIPDTQPEPIRDTQPEPVPNYRDVTVALVDSGVNNHEELQDFIKGAYTVIAGGTDDDDDHGTPMAGTICGITDNVDASTPEIKILSVKFCSQRIPPSATNGAKAIRMALQKMAPLQQTQVIVLAWDCGHRSTELDSAIEAAKDKALVVVAAGNHGLDNDLHPNWPANYSKEHSHVITVMATDKESERASFSNYGKTTVDIAAPGVDILSTVPYFGTQVAGAMFPIGYRSHRGTSAAAAHVARLAALILGKNTQSWTPVQLKAHLSATAYKPKLRLKCVSEGIANYVAALL